MTTIIKIKTWTCSVCNYKQDFEPTKENIDKHFNNDVQFKLNNLQINQCPSCALKGNSNLLGLETDNNKKTTIRIMDENEVDGLELEDKITKQKRKLTVEEKNIIKEKIRADIIKFTAMQ